MGQTHSKIRRLENPFVVCIDGNIGSGKSTLVSRLKRHFRCFGEPVARWTLLKNYYNDPKKYAAALQLQILLTTYDQFTILNTLKEVVVVERCPLTQRVVFVEFLQNKGYINESEKIFFDSVYNKLLQFFKVDLMIFLDANPETCYERISNRSYVPGDEKIGYEYLRTLDRQYKKSLSELPFPCGIIQTNNYKMHEIEEMVVKVIFKMATTPRISQ